MTITTKFENDIADFAFRVKLTLAETSCVPTILQRISEVTGVSKQTLATNIAKFDNELSQEIKRVAETVANEIELIAHLA